MAVTTTKTNKPINPRGDDKSPLAFNRAKIYSGKALDFDGVNDFISTGTQTAFDMKSIAFHFIGAINSNANGFVMHPNDASYNNGVMIGHFSGTLTDECLSIGDGSNFTTTKETFDDGIHFVVFSWDATNSKYKIFVNGVELTTENNGADSSLISDITSPIFGKRAPLNDFYLDGGLSNIRLFNTALTAAQVLDLYNNPEKIVPTGVADSALKLWLPMQEGAGTTAYDGSGNGNHGTISGATWTQGVGAPVAQTAVISWNKGTNLLPYSNDFSQWATSGTNETSGQSGYDGTNNAWLLTKNVSDGYIYQNISQSGVQCVSVYAKANAIGGIQIYVNAGTTQYQSFNLTNGTLIGSGNNIDAKIESVGNGWYRCSMALSDSITRVRFYPTTSAGDKTGTSGSIYIQDAQLESASTAGPYVLTLSNAQSSEVLIPQSLTSGRDLFYNLFENVRKQYALNLDGQSWAEVHDNASFDLAELTLECWFYADSSAVSDGLLGQWSGNQGYLLYVTNSSDFRFYVNGVSRVYSTALTGWNHIAGVYDGATMKLYINGTQEVSGAHTTDPTSIDIPIEIGRVNQATSAQYPNQIAHPRIYNRALTADEVEQNYNAGKNTYS